MPNVSGPEILVLFVIALLVLGPKKLPDVARSVGKGVREFKGALSGEAHDEDDEDDLAEERRLAREG